MKSIKAPAGQARFAALSCRKLSALLLSLVLLLLSLVSCGDKQPDDLTVERRLPTKEITLGYIKADSLNPYTVTTLANSVLLPLMYDSLFDVTARLEPVPSIALSYESSGTKLAVSIDSGVHFSDGSLLTVEDVMYSFNKAKNSSRFSEELACINSVQKTGEHTCVFNLKNENPYAVCLLTFPIVKNMTAESDDSLPIGSGKYVLQSDERLCHNSLHSADILDVGAIRLHPMSGDENIRHLLDLGTIDAFVYDLSGSRVSAALTNKTTVARNRFLFMGINSQNYTLAIPNVRRALSFGVNRSELADSVFSTMLRPAYTPFSPDWTVFDSIEKSNNNALDYNSATAVLEEEGFTDALPSGVRSGVHGVLDYSLLVNQGNDYRMNVAESIRSSLRKLGVNINIKALPYAEYLTALSEGNFDLYLGEVLLPADGDLSVFFTSNKAAAVGIAASSPAREAYHEYRGGSLSVESFLADFNADMPFIPLGYGSDLLVCSRRIKQNDAPIYINDALSGIVAWSVSLPTEEGTAETISNLG